MKLGCILYLLLHVISIFYQANAFTMEMHPIHSPHLQILPQSFTMEERAQFLVDMSVSRSFYADKRNAKLAPDSIQYQLSQQGTYFVTQLTFGKHDPAFSPYVFVDMTSNQTWIQCSKCNPCFKLKDSIPVENSTSYRQMIIDDTRCIPKKNYEGSCGFEASLGKGHTEGYVGTDIFIFDTSSQKKPSYFPNIAFGCGIHNNNFDFGGDKIAGIHGLSPGTRSFINQLSQDIKGRFSYCIPRGEHVTTTMSFGDDAQISGGQTISMNPDARYHLYLAAITLEGVRLPIDPAVFELNEKDYSTGFFIDPSTPVTMLTNSAYTILAGAVSAYYALHEWIPLPTPGKYHLCVIPLPKITLPPSKPKVVLNFIKSAGDSGEVDLELDDDSVFDDIGPLALAGTCLAIRSTSGPSIFGALQQANHQFLFDINARKLSFVPNKC